MKRSVPVFLMALFALVTLVPADASAQWRGGGLRGGWGGRPVWGGARPGWGGGWHGGWGAYRPWGWGAGAVAGLAGLAVGSAIAAPYYGSYPYYADAYYTDPYDYAGNPYYGSYAYDTGYAYGYGYRPYGYRVAYRPVVRRAYWGPRYRYYGYRPAYRARYVAVHGRRYWR